MTCMEYQPTEARSHPVDLVRTLILIVAASVIASPLAIVALAAI
jgi:hypothetical protein